MKPKFGLRMLAGRLGQTLAVPLVAADLLTGLAPAAGAAAVPCVGMAGQQPSGEQLTGVAVLSPCSIWTVGGGTISHWDGATWTASPTPGTTGGFFDIHAFTASDIWAVGSDDDQSLIEHWDGSSWKVSPDPHPADRVDTLFGVTAISPTNAWAVGVSHPAAGSPDSTASNLIEHWNGTAWTRFTAVPTGGETLGLAAVAAWSATNAWAVGFTLADTPRHLHGLILHWDGKSWSQVSIPANVSGLSGVAVVSATEAWAVGSTGLNSTSAQVILHWDGSSWQPAPTPPGAGRGLTSVTVRSASDAWAVGGDSSAQGSLVEHWDGTAWTVVPAPAGVARLDEVSAGPPGTAWAVGRDNASPSHAVALRLRVG